jgi:rRNA-processing protein Efg1
LAANVRVEAERRQKALEAELGQAEQAKKERTLSVKYHKVKFFGTLLS